MTLVLETLPVMHVAPPAPKTYEGDHCTDCGRPISSYSRGRCKPCGDVARARVAPDDFLQQLELRGSIGCAKHYQASLTTITKWRKAAGLKAQLRARRASRSTGMARRPYARPVMIKRDHTEVGQAADFLRRYGAVYRCGERGLPNAKGEFWNRNGHVLTDEDIMARAGRLGWVPVRVF